MKLVLLTDNVFAQKWVIFTGMFVAKCIYFDLLLHCWHAGVSMVKTMDFTQITLLQSVVIPSCLSQVLFNTAAVLLVFG